MATYMEQLQAVWHAFEKEHGKAPATARQAVLWGVERGMIQLPPADPLGRMAMDMSRALRSEFAVDRHGRRYRKNIALRVMRAGVQHTIWSRLEDAPPEFVRESFAQRRSQIIGDCVQLDNDASVWNSLNPAEKPIQLDFDFRDEVKARRPDGQGDMFTTPMFRNKAA